MVAVREAQTRVAGPTVGSCEQPDLYYQSQPKSADFDNKGYAQNKICNIAPIFKAQFI